MTTRSKSTPDKPKATPLTVKIPISKGYSVTKLAHWLSTLEGATEDILDTFTVSDLKLIILCARDRELSYRDLNSSGFNDIRANLTALTDNMVQLNKKVEANASLFVDSTAGLKTYAEASSNKDHTCEQLRSLLKEDNAMRKLAAEEEVEKKKRENNIIVYGLTEDIQSSDCSKEFLLIAEDLQLKPKILEVYRLGKIREDNKPRPLKIRLDSKFIREKILANAHKLKNNGKYNKVYLKPDLSLKERKLQNELWLESKNNVSGGPNKKVGLTLDEPSILSKD